MRICNPFGEMILENLKEQVQVFYFQENDVTDERLDSIFSLAVHLGDNKARITDWERTLGLYSVDVLEAEGTIQNAPSVPVEEVKQIVSKFIECQASSDGYSHGDSS